MYRNKYVYIYRVKPYRCPGQRRCSNYTDLPSAARSVAEPSEVSSTLLTGQLHRTSRPTASSSIASCRHAPDSTRYLPGG